jgi:GMP synthase-like glutamine amidotransferase
MESALYIFKQRKEIGPGWLLDRCEGLTVPVKMRVFGPDVDLPLATQCRGVVIVGLPLPAAAFATKAAAFATKDPAFATKDPAFATKDPALRDQQIFVRTLVGLAVPLLGIGYGAQLLATSLLGQARDPSDPALGPATMDLTADGMVDPLFDGLPRQVPVIRWPAPRLTLPKRAVVLAGTEDRPDAFRLGDCAWALSPHPEVTANGFGDWLADPAHADLVARKDSTTRQDPAALRAAADQQQKAQREAAHRIMDNFLSRVNAFLHDVPPIDVHKPPPGLPDVG